jgi:phosphoglycerate kinase
VAQRLSDLLGRPVAFVDDCVGEAVDQTAAALKPGDILLLENVRFHAQEEANDPAFAAQLAANADVYVNDAFGAAHRAHASTEGIARVVSEKGGACAAGLLMERELQFLGEELESPQRPFVVILGGAKVSDKIAVIDRLLEKADSLLIGGAMAYTFKLAKGLKVGKSLVEPDKVEVAQAAMNKAASLGVELILPTDNTVVTPVVTDQLNKKGKPIIAFENPRHNTQPDIPDEEEGVDIGQETAQAYAAKIAQAKTILWNGPMGIRKQKTQHKN